jgi:hypothetical protein
MRFCNVFETLERGKKRNDESETLKIMTIRFEMKPFTDFLVPIQNLRCRSCSVTHVSHIITEASLVIGRHIDWYFILIFSSIAHK